ncbi:MAG: hypothetical protein P4L99_22890 [Chthoniobacter sp.]|nr:hypothetical protein [Chthoniobacter sp.]
MHAFLSFLLRALIFVGLIAAFMHFVPPRHYFSGITPWGSYRLEVVFAVGAFIALFVPGRSLSDRNYISTRPLVVAFGCLLMLVASGGLWMVRNAVAE